MKSIRLFLSIAIILIFFSTTTPGFAQTTSPLSATVDRDTLSIGETLTLQVSISGNSLRAPQPEMPSLDGFEIVNTGTVTQMNMSMGSLLNSNTTVTNTYRLQPTRTGDLVIDSIRITIDGQTYETQPINIHVTDTSDTTQNTPQAGIKNQTTPQNLTGQDFYVKAEVDHQNPYQGEQITYTFYFYHAIELYDQPYFTPPSFTGFWSENQSSSDSYQTVAANRAYTVNELKTILFPTTAGTLTIDPAQLTIPSSFFNQRVDLQTEAIDISVKPLPEDAPDDFSGAVGQFSISQEIDAIEGKVNEPITQKVILQGTGNMNNLPDPIWQDISDWRSFDSTASSDIQTVDDTITGTRTYERLMVPSKEGQYTIPAVSYTYFDPIAGQYQTIQTEPLQINVGAAALDITPVATMNQKEVVEQIGSDIRYLKPATAGFKGTAAPLTGHRIYWLAWLVPLFILSGNFFWQKRQTDLQNNLSLLRSSKARRIARKSISEAVSNNSDVYSAAGNILLAYLSDKLNQPVIGLTHDALNNLLSGRGLPQELTSEIQNFLLTSEMGRYAPDNSPSERTDLLHNLSELIDRLEKYL